MDLLRDLQGTIVERRTLRGIRLTETRYGPGFEAPKHCHDHSLVGWVFRGFYTNKYCCAVHEVRRPVMMFCPAGEVHDTVSPQGAHCFNLELEPAWVERLQAGGFTDRPTTFELGPLAGLTTRLYREFKCTDQASVLAIEGLALEIVASASRQRGRRRRTPPRWLDEVKDIVHARFSESLTIAGMARDVGIHPVHLASTFRRSYGRSVGDYVRDLRVAHACHLLADPDQSLAEIAHLSGFADQSHFGRIFKRCVGITPGAYRSEGSARRRRAGTAVSTAHRG